jgi:hypothetical protein
LVRIDLARGSGVVVVGQGLREIPVALPLDESKQSLNMCGCRGGMTLSFTRSLLVCLFCKYQSAINSSWYISICAHSILPWSMAKVSMLVQLVRTRLSTQSKTRDTLSFTLQSHHAGYITSKQIRNLSSQNTKSAPRIMQS